VLSFSISAVRDGRVTIEGNEKLVVLERSLARGYYVEPGDLLLVRGNGNLSLVGTCGLVDTAPDECTYPDILMLMRVNDRVAAEFLVAALNSPYVRAQVESLAQTTKLDAVRAATERTIALLKERRAALIAAAVTGQLDVGPAA
jgi:type I restriction enzyme S subunit